ncbi:MAG: hypothetical protein V1797_20750, partial [Pseudomonadota bacterium]
LPPGGLAAEAALDLVAALVAAALGPGGLGHVKLSGADADGRPILVSATGPADLSRRGPAADLVGRVHLALIAANRDAASLQAGLARLLPTLEPGLAQALARELPSLPGLGGLGGLGGLA